jgi:hypothetical protein
MIAVLLYLIGLVVVLVTIAVAGYNAPQTIGRFSQAMDAGNVNMVDLTLSILPQYYGPITAIVGGLLLMAAARVLMLLGSINRSLRGQN